MRLKAALRRMASWRMDKSGSQSSMATVLRPTVSRRAGSMKQQAASGHSSGEREESVSRISACASPTAQFRLAFHVDSPVEQWSQKTEIDAETSGQVHQGMGSFRAVVVQQAFYEGLFVPCRLFRRTLFHRETGRIQYPVSFRHEGSLRLAVCQPSICCKAMRRSTFSGAGFRASRRTSSSRCVRMKSCVFSSSMCFMGWVYNALWLRRA